MGRRPDPTRTSRAALFIACPIVGDGLRRASVTPHRRSSFGMQKAGRLLTPSSRGCSETCPIQPENQTCDAIRYALSRWEGLTLFVGDGGIELLEAPLPSALPFVASLRSCAIWAASSIAPCVIRMRRCVSSPYWERAFSQNCTYARCILGNPLHSRSVWSSWESSCNRAQLRVLLHEPCVIKKRHGIRELAEIVVTRWLVCHFSDLCFA
jgi:hypothetical protein